MIDIMLLYTDMEAKCLLFVCLTLFDLLLVIKGTNLQNVDEKEMINGNQHKECQYLNCEKGGICIHRKFHCKHPPCPDMLYCAKSRRETLRGPTACDTVRCSRGYMCTLKVNRCRWDEKCEHEVARCVSKKEYYEGPASCAGYKCPQGNHCILREAFCASPPCKLLRSCPKNKEAHVWLAKCRSLGCPSEYECFLRRPENNCSNPPCKHTPDCIPTNENEEISEHCRGWVCPKMQKCVAETVKECETNDCTIKKTCQEVKTTEINNSSTTFARRSLRNQENTKDVENRMSKDTFQKTEVKGRETPHSHKWLHHLQSKAELDAIELWIENAERQKDFQHFQDWLRSVEDILGSREYSDWLKEILSSRGEEFQKWLRASHGEPDAEEPTFPGQEGSRALTENPYPVHDTLKVPPSDNLNRRIEEIESLLKGKNATSVLKKILVPNRILLPPYTGLETELLNNLKKSNRSPFFNYILKYPFYVGNQFLTVPPSNMENTYDQPYLVIPVKDVKDLANSPIINYSPNSELQNQQEIIPENRKISDDLDTTFSVNTPGMEDNVTPTKDELSSPWFRLDENIEEKSPEKETHSIEDSIDHPEDNSFMEKPDDVPIDFLEKFLKSMHLSAIENPPETFEEDPVEEYHQDSLPKDLQNEEYNQNLGWDSISHTQDDNDDESSDESVNQFSRPGDGNGNLTNSPESEINMLLDKLDGDRSLNHSDRSNDADSGSALQQAADKNNDEMELSLFFELNKENLLPYMQTLMKFMNEEHQPINFNTEPKPDESLVKGSLADNEQTVTEKYLDRSESLKTEPPDPFVKTILNGANNRHVSHLSEEENVQQVKKWRTPELIHGGEMPMINSFYDLPSYGAINGDDDLQDYMHIGYNHTDHENDNIGFPNN